MQDLKTKIETALDKGLLSTRSLLSKFRVIDERSRETSVYLDNTYFPFYYYLGKLTGPKKVFESDFGLGLHTAAFLSSDNQVEDVLVHHHAAGYYSPRIGLNNLRLIYKKSLDFSDSKITDRNFLDKLNSTKRDMLLLHHKMAYDKQRSFLDLLWDSLNFDGLLVLDHVFNENRQAFLDFCKITGRDPIIVNTRYGVGIVKK